MKISIYLLLLLFSCYLFAQKVDLKSLETKNVNSDQSVYPPVSSITIKSMAVYPGCESFREKKDLIICFNQKLSNDLLKFLDTEFPRIQEPKELLIVKMEFLINKNGIIENIRAKSGDIEFRTQAIKAFENVSQYLVNSDEYIKPAKLQDGSIANLIFQNKVSLINPRYDISDWIYVFHKKGYSPEGILLKLKMENINQFEIVEIRQYLDHLKNGNKESVVKNYLY